jgi:carbon monoxide dehydrogenase subunit G
MTRITGAVHFNTSTAQIWRFFTTPAWLSNCLPGLTAWEVIEPDKKFHLRLLWGAGDNTAGFQIPVLLEWTELVPPWWMSLNAHAMFGGVPIPGAGSFRLTPLAATQTELDFSAEFTPPNKMLDQLIRTAAPKLIDTFFHCCKETLKTGFDTPGEIR